ncbi:hypothetical protein [Polyangium sorediatum]|uniref:EF-hand domain-containing protein n=1 Tax=Polyangium sorediatum TaxID=889274 RepID=A0ABT6NSS6_9BACT|nr:hypothetical protein [Polyangium sorediatum]MDI1431385.1 hypothetical protein [Polyangium sorediatum]
MFDVDVAGDGQVDKARVRESMIDDREIVSCMEDALHGMSLPGVVTPLRSSGPVYGNSVSPDGRTPMGHPAAAAAVAGAAVNLIPIVLAAGGVTILVAVTAHVAEEVVEAVEAAGRRRAVERRCYELQEECLENPWQPEDNKKIYGEKKDCRGCLRECLWKSIWPAERCPRPGNRSN